MHDSAVVGRLVASDLALLLEHCDLKTRPPLTQLAGQSEPKDAGSHHDNVAASLAQPACFLARTTCSRPSR